MDLTSKNLKRKISESLKQWWESKDKRPFLLLGARQTGKTKSINIFMEEEGLSSPIHSCSIDFVKQPNILDIFRKNQDPADIVNEIRMLPAYSKLDLDGALFFFDEVQVDSAVITALENFAKQSKYRIIATGSLINIAMGKSKHPDSSLFRKEEMYPLDFEEFLWANGVSSEEIERIKKISNQSGQMLKTDNDLHKKCLELFRLFTIIGGLPEPVFDYLNEGKEKCYEVLANGLLSKYKDDIKKAYKDNYLEANAVDQMIKSIPYFLARDNRKFLYKEISKDEKVIDQYRKAISFMNEAGFGYSIASVYPILLPFSKKASPEDFKFYPFDSGILNALQSESAFLSMFENTDYDSSGDCYETAVLAIMKSRGFSPFYSHFEDEDPKTQEKQEGKCFEIDFLLETKDGRFSAIEVKAGKSKAKSIAGLINNSNYKGGYKFGGFKIGKDEKIKLITMPIYALQFIDKAEFGL